MPAHNSGYRGRLAPTPTGWLHLGHAQTFFTAAQRAVHAGGVLVLRNEDLDASRCREEFVSGAIEDLHWLGLYWQEGPDVGGPYGPYSQSQRGDWYRTVWRRLAASGQIYPSPHSRKDVAEALTAPHPVAGAGPEEPLFPPALRPATDPAWQSLEDPGPVNWRFRVPDGRQITFVDGRVGRVTRTAGSDFGDFLVWRKDGFPSYELAVVADDHAMHITEVVRGEDLLTSTARQILLYEALGWAPPAWYHCPLVCDATGERLAKRNSALSLRELRRQPRSRRGIPAAQVPTGW